MLDNKNNEIKRLNGIYENLLGNAGVEIIHGRASIIDAHTVSVSGKEYTTNNILVATGGWPLVPDIPGKQHILLPRRLFI